MVGYAPTALLKDEEDSMAYCVYKHTSPHGKVYIGITCQDPRKRWGGGAGYLNNPYFYNAISKYGWDNFSHEILFSELSKEEAEAKEIELIALYDSTNRDKGYNHELGGNSAGKTTEEIRRKISKSRTGKCVGKDHPAYGKPLGEEARRKLSEANRGKKRPRSAAHCKRISAVRRKPVTCVETGIRYNSGLEAEEHTGISRANICSCCAGNRKTAGGFRWKYA